MCHSFIPFSSSITWRPHPRHPVGCSLPRKVKIRTYYHQCTYLSSTYLFKYKSLILSWRLSSEGSQDFNFSTRLICSLTIQGAAARASVAHWTVMAPKRTTNSGSMWVNNLVLTVHALYKMLLIFGRRNLFSLSTSSKLKLNYLICGTLLVLTK